MEESVRQVGYLPEESQILRHYSFYVKVIDVFSVVLKDVECM
jgi:hypothetical protein